MVAERAAEALRSLDVKRGKESEFRRTDRSAKTVGGNPFSPHTAHPLFRCQTSPALTSVFYGTLRLVFPRQLGSYWEGVRIHKQRLFA